MLHKAQPVAQVIGYITICLLAIYGLSCVVGSPPAWAMPARAPAAPNVTPGIVNYQGKLTDSLGRPIEGRINITFRLYTTPTGGAPIWLEAHTNTNAVPVSNGVFNVLLGSLTPIPATAWANSALYLGVQVGTDVEMTPREMVSMVAYALQASRAFGLSAADGDPADKITVENDGALASADDLQFRVRTPYTSSDVMRLTTAGNVAVSGNVDMQGRLLIGSKRPIVFAQYAHMGHDVYYETNFNSQDYECAVAGFVIEGGRFDPTGPGAIMALYTVADHGLWHIRAYVRATNPSEDWTINLMCIDSRLAGWGVD